MCFSWLHLTTFTTLLLLTLLPSPARAVRIPGFFHTGVDDNGVPLGDREDDPHYEIILGPNGEAIADETMAEDGFPIPPWIPNDDDARWIGPVDGGNSDGNVDPGSLLFQTSFNMTGLDHTNAAIVGWWATDNVGQDILLNGVPIPFAPQSGFADGNQRWFGVNSVSAAIAGTSIASGFNTMIFQVENLPPDVNPAGLRVDNVYAEAAPIGTVRIPGLYNTGVDASGILLADDAEDENYSLITSPDGTILPARALSVPPSPPWVSNTGASRWIAPSNDTAGNAPPGVYQYETEFDLSGLDPESVVISGLWSVDDDGDSNNPPGDILLNGTPVGIEQMGAFPQLTRFDVSAAAGHSFNAGTNTLTFTVTNGGAENNPTGLRIAGLVAYANELAGLRGDFDNDGEFTCEDLDALYEEIRTGSSAFDLTGDDVVDGADIDAWLVAAGAAKGFTDAILPGDSDLNGVVNSTDLNVVGINWQADDATSWCQGDFNADQAVNSLDLNDLGINWQDSVQAGQAANAVPEPCSIWAVVMAILPLTIKRRSRLFCCLGREVRS